MSLRITARAGLAPRRQGDRLKSNQEEHAHDVTDRVEAEERLGEWEEQYRSIFEVSSDGFAITDLETGLVVDANPAMCRMHGYTYEEIIGLHPTEFVHPDYHEAFRKHSETVKSGGSYRARSVDLRKDGTPFHVDVQGTTFTYKGKPRRLAILRDITEQVQAYELLEQRVEERTRELSTLLEISHNVSSTLELQPLLGLILDQLKAVVDFDGATIMAVEGEELVNLYRLGPDASEDVVQRHFPMTTDGLLWKSMHCGEPVIISDVWSSTALAEEYRRVNGELMETTLDYVRSWMGVPMMLKERVVGWLTLASAEQDHYTTHHGDLALAIASQAAVAIENARLYEKSKDLAALEERQRLARELHDSVSQALFGIGLGAKTARTVIERDPAKAIEFIEYVHALAKTGMAEMRALIFELRPESLEKEGLVQALLKQAEAVSARHGISVQPTLCDEPVASLPVKEAIYRIAQEAMHNTVKHAQAGQMQLSLTWSEREVVLEISDDGAGFDTAASYPGHLGLHSMEERSTQLGGTLQVERVAAGGTRICARIPLRPVTDRCTGS
jgi:PAS domain S-box-containing protein